MPTSICAIFIAAFTFFSSSALASFSGKWRGPGQYSRNSQAPEECSRINVELYQTADKLFLDGFDFKCDSIFGFMLKDEADLVNGEIWYRGRRAGFISDTKLNFTWTANNVQTEIVLEKNRDGSLALQRTEIYLQSRDITVLSSAALEPMP